MPDDLTNEDNPLHDYQDALGAVGGDPGYEKTTGTRFQRQTHRTPRGRGGSNDGQQREIIQKLDALMNMMQQFFQAVGMGGNEPAPQQGRNRREKNPSLFKSLQDTGLVQDIEQAGMIGDRFATQRDGFSQLESPSKQPQQQDQQPQPAAAAPGGEIEKALAPLQKALDELRSEIAPRLEGLPAAIRRELERD